MDGIEEYHVDKIALTSRPSQIRDHFRHLILYILCYNTGISSIGHYCSLIMSPQSVLSLAVEPPQWPR
jgi:hypothetical protein